jgi:hypothetical protein
MTISVFYYEAEPGGGYVDPYPVAYYFDANSMTILQSTDQRVVDFVGGGGTIGAYEAPADPLPTPSHLNSGGLARFTGTTPPGMLENIRMAGVTRVSKGRYRATHETAMPSDQYSALVTVFDANPRTIRVTARTANYVEVRVTDLAGAVQDPTEITIKTERVVTAS